MKIAVILIAILILGGAGIGVAVLGIKSSLEEMKTQDVLFLVTDGKDVEVAIGFMIEQKIPVAINPGDIQGLYTSSGPASLIGEELGGFPLSGDLMDGERIFRETKPVSFQRIVTVEASVIGDIVERAGGIRLQFEGAGVKLSKDMTDEDVMGIITGDDLSGSGRWTIMFKNPLSGREEMREIDGSDIESLAETFNIDLETWVIKIAVLGGVGEQIGKMDRDSRKEGIKTLIDAYKDGRIKTYPQNAVTRIAKFAPAGLIADKVAAD